MGRSKNTFDKKERRIKLLSYLVLTIFLAFFISKVSSKIVLSATECSNYALIQQDFHISYLMPAEVWEEEELLEDEHPGSCNHDYILLSWIISSFDQVNSPVYILFSIQGNQSPGSAPLFIKNRNLRI